MNFLFEKFISIIRDVYTKVFNCLAEKYPTRRDLIMKIKDIIISVLSIVGVVVMILFFAVPTIDKHKESLLRQKKLQLEIENLSKTTDSQLKLEIEKLKTKQLELELKLQQINKKELINSTSSGWTTNEDNNDKNKK